VGQAKFDQSNSFLIDCGITQTRAFLNRSDEIIIDIFY